MKLKRDVLQKQKRTLLPNASQADHQASHFFKKEKKIRIITDGREQGNMMPWNQRRKRKAGIFEIRAISKASLLYQLPFCYCDFLLLKMARDPSVVFFCLLERREHKKDLLGQAKGPSSPPSCSLSGQPEASKKLAIRT